MANGVQHAPRASRHVPVGPTAQLGVLQTQLASCTRSLHAGIRDTASAMRNEALSEGQRWAQVRGLRTLAWKVVREVLPLMERIPASLQGTPAHTECLRVAHELRRTAESALSDNANYTVDLLSASTLPGRTW